MTHRSRNLCREDHEEMLVLGVGGKTPIRETQSTCKAPCLGFKPGSQRWKAGKETTGPTCRGVWAAFGFKPTFVIILCTILEVNITETVIIRSADFLCPSTRS